MKRHRCGIGVQSFEVRNNVQRQFITLQLAVALDLNSFGRMLAVPPPFRRDEQAHELPLIACRVTMSDVQEDGSDSESIMFFLRQAGTLGR